jgi:DNA-binding NarL/FixJ family response regulator
MNKPSYRELAKRILELENESLQRELIEAELLEKQAALRAQNISIVRKSIELSDIKRELEDKNYDLELSRSDLEKTMKALRKAHDELELRVEERTRELAEANEGLQAEISERKRAEAALREREAALESKSNELQELNRALRVLLRQREKDRRELEEKVLFNVKELVLPYIRRLRRTRLNGNQMTCVSVLESNLDDIVSPFVHKLSIKYLSLTPKEIQIANLVKHGSTIKQIAELLMSQRTVEGHRQNIRMKLGLSNKKANLKTHLLSI